MDNINSSPPPPKKKANATTTINVECVKNTKCLSTTTLDTNCSEDRIYE